MAEVAPRPWKVQAMEAREKEMMASLIRKKLEDRSMTREERAVWVRELDRLYSEIKDPDYSSMTEDERAAEAERVRQEALEEAAHLKREGGLLNGWVKERLARLLDFDPKQDGRYYARLHAVDLLTFNHDEESPIGPGRFTRGTYKNGRGPSTCKAVNILSVKIACSDVGFPIQVYGSVIARDSTDFKCLSLFHRDRDHCQLINSEVESLILTGPNRGLGLLDYNYVETDLKIKDHQEGKDRELSKGILAIKGIRTLIKCEVETRSLATRLSTVDVSYAVVRDAVEGSFVIRVIKGKFDGTITAHTTSVQEKIVVYDSKVAGAQSRRVRGGLLQLMRPALSVFVGDKLIVVAETYRESVCREFTPAFNGEESAKITLGATKNEIDVTVAWSMMDP